MKESKESQKWLPFITQSKENVYILNPQIGGLLKGCKMRVVSMMGKQKTGKSFLMNKLRERLIVANPEQMGGGCDSADPGMEDGIWLLRAGNVVLLDSRASSSNERGIYQLCYLLSSTVLYNSMGAIDEYSLSKLALCLNGLRQDRSLLWIMRDFALEITDAHGAQITPNQYLESALCENKTNQAKNFMRKELKSVFPSRSCFPFVLPSEDYPISPSSRLRPPFLTSLHHFADCISTQTPTLTFQSHSLDSQSYFKFAQYCVITLNSKQNSFIQDGFLRYMSPLKAENQDAEEMRQKKQEAEIDEEQCLCIGERKKGEKKGVKRYKISEQSRLYVPYLLIRDEKQVEISVARTLIKENKEGRIYVEYSLSVQMSLMRWTVLRKWKDFCHLHSILTCMYPYLWLPPLQLPPATYTHTLDPQLIESRRRTLEFYLLQLLTLHSIRNSRIMQKFLKINQEYVSYL